MSNRDLILDSTALIGTLMMFRSFRFINCLRRVMESKKHTSSTYEMNGVTVDRRTVAYQKSIKIVRSTFSHAIDRLKNTLELATEFKDTDKVEDRERILR